MLPELAELLMLRVPDSRRAQPAEKNIRLLTPLHV